MLLSHLIHQRPKFINVLKTAINAGKTDVGDLVEFFQLGHHQFADFTCGNFARPPRQQVLADALDRSGGYEAALSWNGLFRAGGFTFIPGASVKWQSDDMIDYYYGVRAGEALPGRPAYRGEAAVIPDVSLLVQRKLGPRWTLFARASHPWLPSEVTDSPIVGDDNPTSLFIGLGWSPE